jgi:hypothetical protein
MLACCRAEATKKSLEETLSAPEPVARRIAAGFVWRAG